MRCAVVGCDSDNQSKRNPCKNVKFFSFPKDDNLSKKWLHLTKREDKVNLKNAVICSKHFCESDYKVNLKHIFLDYIPKNYRGLKDDAIPTQNLPQSQCVSLLGSSTSGAGEKRKKNVCLFLHDRDKEITEPRPKQDNMIDFREGENLDCNMVVESSTTSEIG
ncbi:hypothetical protein NQ318_002942 [Aromia moschata]|uniref:THAP-type domain-containing protein n=1 Tax=Aromia moschata TaxID=1265417 RepID=A0AAV8X2L7_9CUCU|nr:hypothetical protein NQ318_002942 [Aromia moschata]